MNMFLSFFKISALTFGGGYAMLPMIEKELVEDKKQLGHQDMVDDYAMGQTIPGVIGVNTSALIGYRLAGRTGLVSAVLGFITPSIIIISIIATLLTNIDDSVYLEKAFIGLRAGVVALMLNSLINISKKTLTNVLGYILFVLALIGVLIFSFHPFFLILGGAVIGLVKK